MGKFSALIYGDIYALGCGYKRACVSVAKFFVGCFKKLWHFVCRIAVVVFTFLRVRVFKYFVAVKDECVKFFREVKKAMPDLKTEFKSNPFKGIAKFFKYTAHAFAVHKKFNRAVLSTIIPVLSLCCLFALVTVTKGVTFALSVAVDGHSVGIVRNEDAYKQAEKDARQRFSALGSSLAKITPVYTVTISTVDNLDDNETVCNNIIAAVSENTRNACGVYINGEFLCTVGSEDTFFRVSNKVLSEYTVKNALNVDSCTVEFNDKITAVTGLYPSEAKKMTADELYAYMTGYSAAKKEHIVAEDEKLDDILDKYNITEEQLLLLNPNLDTEFIPQGSVLLIERGDRNLSIKHTMTYVSVEKIPFDTVTQFDNNLFIGTTMTVVSGIEGQDVVSYTDTFVDGKKISSAKEILRYNARMPVNQLIKYGTMGVPVGDDDAPVSPRLIKDQGGRFVWPAPDNCFWLSQNYNPYNSHYGIDIVSSDDGSCRGRRIVAVADGIVTMATYHYSWGYYIRVDHGSGVVTGYAHALQGSFRVNVGDYVKAGQHLSSIGTTGNSTGYHLHFEVWIDGTRVNPLPYVYSENTGVAVK